MGYGLEVLPIASAQVKRLDKAIGDAVLQKMHWLCENFEQIRPLRLTGEYKEFFKERVGTYRIFYTADRTQRRITVHRVAHRSKAYRKR